MALVALKCPNCAAPITSPGGTSVVCVYCGHALVDMPTPWVARPVIVPPYASRAEDKDKPRALIQGHEYVVLELLGQGDSSDVYLARRDSRLSELVVLKVLKAKEDADLLANEWRILKRLSRSDVQGADYFSQLLPQPVVHGAMQVANKDAGLASVFRWHSGFFDTLTQARAAYPAGIPAGASVWMWKRTLEQLGWIHESGLVHGAVLPQHLLIHPRDHGVCLIGWSAATWRYARSAGARHARSASSAEYYPERVWRGGAPTPSTDITMSARCIAYVLGGDATGAMPRSIPGPLKKLIRAHLMEAQEDAWSLADKLSAVARQVYGPPKYVRFKMPKRRSHHGIR